MTRESAFPHPRVQPDPSSDHLVVEGDGYLAPSAVAIGEAAVMRDDGLTHVLTFDFVINVGGEDMVVGAAMSSEAAMNLAVQIAMSHEHPAELQSALLAERCGQLAEAVRDALKLRALEAQFDTCSE